VVTGGGGALRVEGSMEFFEQLKISSGYASPTTFTHTGWDYFFVLGE